MSLGAAVVVGGGGLGSALAARLAADGGHTRVTLLSRRGERAPTGCEAGRIDVGDAASVAAAFAASDEPLTLVIVATGVLAGGGPQGRPERSLAGLDADAMLESYRINAVGPALVARHAAARLPRRGRAVFAALSARVGSIGDNRLGGWHGYRASKAALNMLVRGAAIEWARTRPDAIALALHPGTVRTPLSRPLLRDADWARAVEPDVAAERLLAVIAAATAADSGRFLAYDGSPIPF